jgi:hypothetical protein
MVHSPPPAHGLPTSPVAHPSGGGLAHTPQGCQDPEPASSVTRQRAWVQAPASHGCPISVEGHATGSQNPQGLSAVAPSGAVLLHIEATQRPVPHQPANVAVLVHGWPTEEAGHCCAPAGLAMAASASDVNRAVHFMPEA